MRYVGVDLHKKVIKVCVVRVVRGKRKVVVRKRLEKMLRLNIIPEEEYHEIENIYSRMMEIRFRSHVNAILNNKSPDNMVNRDELTVIEQTMIRKTFSEIIQ